MALGRGETLRQKSLYRSCTYLPVSTDCQLTAGGQVDRVPSFTTTSDGTGNGECLRSRVSSRRRFLTGHGARCTAQSCPPHCRLTDTSPSNRVCGFVLGGKAYIPYDPPAPLGVPHILTRSAEKARPAAMETLTRAVVRRCSPVRRDGRNIKLLLRRNERLMGFPGTIWTQVCIESEQNGRNVTADRSTWRQKDRRKFMQNIDSNP